MKPSIFRITGGHLTARDKRNILDCIEYLRGQDHHNAWLGYKGSPKRYCVTADADLPNIYGVRISENYTTDWGEKRQREWKFTVEAKGIDPLQPVAPKTDPQADLFEGMSA